MKELLIFAGTTEGRELSELLCAAGVAHTVCVATEYGEAVLKEHPLAHVHCGRMDQNQMREYMKQGAFAAVVDATHPYATEVTENIKAAVSDLALPYLRLRRGEDVPDDKENGSTKTARIYHFTSHEACAQALQKTEGNILLTTGSKNLAVYTSTDGLKDRLYVRVLPGMESLSLCVEQGICGKQILALQGPFKAELNEAILRQYRIACLVTKESGKSGGYREKLEAARRLDIPVYVIGREKAPEGDSFLTVCRKLEELCQKKIVPEEKWEILLAGAGMGGGDTLTKEVADAIENADILIGAGRLIGAYRTEAVKKEEYLPDRIVSYLEACEAPAYSIEMQKGKGSPGRRRVVILFSGDSGFYSGCKSVYRALRTEIEAGRLKASLHISPGISSVAYLAACIGESYEDAALYSMHGKALPNLVKKLKHSSKTFLLTAGVKDLNRLGGLLEDADMAECRIWAGYRLSYPDQQLLCLTPGECRALAREGLYTCCVLNPCAEPERLTPGRADEEFIRGKTPMTKEEVREVSICKLKLYRGAVVYDIGSGTGSVSVEIAELCDDIFVYAVEKKDEAAALIAKNKEKFGLENIEILTGEAPEILEKLPVPTHAFIGGSGGNLQEILAALYQKNPRMRVVVNAVTLETLGEIQRALSDFPVSEPEIVQIQATRGRRAGSYHLMQAENPVWICAFDFREQ